MQKHLGRRDFVRIGGGTALGLTMASSLRSTRAATTVSYGTPGGAVEDEAWKPVFETFNANQSDIEARYTPLGGNYGPEYLQNLQARIAAGNAPDLFFIPSDQLAAFAERNVITSLDELIQGSDVNLDEFFVAHIESLTYQDKLWGLPRDGAPVALFYNADMFDEAGVSYPDETWDWNTFLTAAQTLTKRDEGGRAQQLGTARGEWVNWVWQAGGDVLNEDNTQCLLAEPAAIEGLRFLQDLVLEHQVAPSEEDLADQEEADMFIAGRLAMYFAARGGLGAICNGATFRFSAAVPPKGEVRAARTNVGPTILWSGSKNPEAAFELMKFISSAEGQRLKISTGYAFPSLKSSTYEEWFTEFQCAESIDDGINVAFR